MGTPKGKRRDFEALEKRRFEAMRLLDEGLNQSETARRLTVARQTVSEWRRQYLAQGEAGLRKAGRAGRKPLLDATQLERLEILLLEGPEAHGFPTPLWSCPRVARLIRDEFGVRYPRAMSGRSCGRSAGARNARSAKPASATKRPSATGSARGGRPLKKSPQTRPHDRLHRRKRMESEAASLPHLGAARRDAAAGVQLQLAEAFGVGRVDVAQLLLSALSRRDWPAFSI